MLEAKVWPTAKRMFWAFLGAFCNFLVAHVRFASKVLDLLLHVGAAAIYSLGKEKEAKHKYSHPQKTARVIAAAICFTHRYNLITSWPPRQMHIHTRAHTHVYAHTRMHH